MSRRRRLAMVNRGHPGLSVVKQCRLLQLSRSAVYYLVNDIYSGRSCCLTGICYRNVLSL